MAAPVAETTSPRRVESSLLVVEDFTDANGYEWRIGDRASLAYSAVRRAATETPELFRVEWETAPLDPEAEWFQAIVETHEARYEERKAAHEAEAANREKALREELKQQGKGQPDLERRYREQEREREERAQRAREAFERERIERELEHTLGPPGFHN
jgi:hypothetical protein